MFSFFTRLEVEQKSSSFQTNKESKASRNKTTPCIFKMAQLLYLFAFLAKYHSDSSFLYYITKFFFFLRIIEEVMTCLEKYICYTNAKGSHHFWLLIICNHPTVKTSFWNMFIRCTWFLVVSTFPENKANPVRICIIIIFPKGTHKISETWTLSIEKSYFTFHKHFLQ